MQCERRAEGLTPSGDRSLNMPVRARHHCQPKRLSNFCRQICVLLHATIRSLTSLLARNVEGSPISMLACPCRRTTWSEGLLDSGVCKQPRSRTPDSIMSMRVLEAVFSDSDADTDAAHSVHWVSSISISIAIAIAEHTFENSHQA
jgi:hypothetical protein